MAVIIKTTEEISLIREAGRRLAEVVARTIEQVRPGITSKELDTFAENLILSMGDKPAFKGYQPDMASAAFPATLCLSINEEVVHGIPSDRVVKEGDLVTVDCGNNHKGFFADHAISVIVGEVSQKIQNLNTDTKKALEIGIAEAVVGNRVGDIGYAIEQFVAGRYGIVRVLSGHGVGKYIHEEPYVPNYGKKNSGVPLAPGMIIAIEPMLTLGTEDVLFHDDGYTVTTADKSYSSHFEHTVLITENGPEILTQMQIR
ncbi:MAG: methionyl aminopeptidase [Planctomycetota bacterium]|jgi:methionyl aminopeptidase